MSQSRIDKERRELRYLADYDRIPVDNSECDIDWGSILRTVDHTSLAERWVALRDAGHHSAGPNEYNNGFKRRVPVIPVLAQQVNKKGQKAIADGYGNYLTECPWCGQEDVPIIGGMASIQSGKTILNNHLVRLGDSDFCFGSEQPIKVSEIE